MSLRLCGVLHIPFDTVRDSEVGQLPSNNYLIHCSASIGSLTLLPIQFTVDNTSEHNWPQQSSRGPGDK